MMIQDRDTNKHAAAPITRDALGPALGAVDDRAVDALVDQRTVDALVDPRMGELDRRAAELDQRAAALAADVAQFKADLRTGGGTLARNEPEKPAEPVNERECEEVPLEASVWGNALLCGAVPVLCLCCARALPYCAMLWYHGCPLCNSQKHGGSRRSRAGRSAPARHK